MRVIRSIFRRGLNVIIDTVYVAGKPVTVNFGTGNFYPGLAKSVVTNFS